MSSKHRTLMIGWLFLSALAGGCESSGPFSLRVIFPDEQARQETVRIHLWALVPGQHTCDEILSGAVRPGDMTSMAAMEVPFPAAGPVVLQGVPVGRLLFTAEAENAAGRRFLRACSPVEVTAGRAVEVTLEFVRVCVCDPGFACPDCLDCLSGYYGSSCLPCPGGSDNPCSARGSCVDGIAGDGSCSCDFPYAGTACLGCVPGYTGASCTECAAGYHDSGCGSCLSDSGPPFGGGSGTPEDPFLICTAAQLPAIDDRPEYLAAAYRLERELDLFGLDFEPLGSVASAFTGTFDGQGHTVANLNIQRPDQDHVGLFGVMIEARVHDLALSNAIVAGRDKVGALAGWVRQGSWLSDIQVGGAVAGRDAVGGLMGWAHGSRLERLAAVDVTVVGARYAGGLLGVAYSPGQAWLLLEDSRAEGVVTATSDIAGVLLGIASLGSHIQNCTSSGQATAPAAVGGLVGIAWGANLWGCASDATAVQLPGNTSSTSAGAGGLIGYGMMPIQVQHCQASGDVQAAGTDNAGGLIGNYAGTTDRTPNLQSCSASGQVEGELAVGGLVGRASQVGLDRVFATGAVRGADQVGGLIGSLEGVNLTRAWAGGAVEATENSAGGLVGRALFFADEIETVFSYGPVTSPGTAGGLVGEALDLTVVNGYWDVETSGLGSGNGLPDGSAGGLGYDTAHMQQQATYVGFTFPEEWSLQPGSYPQLVPRALFSITGLSPSSADLAGGVVLEFQVEGLVPDVEVSAVCDPASVVQAGAGTLGCTALPWDYPDGTAIHLLAPDGRVSNAVWFTFTCQPPFQNGSGTQSDPYQIASIEDLRGLRCARSASLVLTADLDLAGFPEVLPLSDDSHPFYGELDGGGHEIANAVLPGEADMYYTGLFGVLSSGAWVHDLFVRNPSAVLPDATNYGYLAVLAGLAGDCLVERVEVQGAGLQAGSDFSVGGLVGFSESPAFTMRDCAFTGTITGNDTGWQLLGGLLAGGGGLLEGSRFQGAIQGGETVGGLVGNNSSGALRIERSSARGVIGSVIPARGAAGGLVGRVQGDVTGITEILDAFAEVDVSSAGTGSYAGGLVGFAYGLRAEHAWAAGALTGTVVGGLVAATFVSGAPNEVLDAYWDVDVSGLGSDGSTEGSLGGTGYNTAHMMQQATFAGFDFVDIWLMIEGVDYPRLRQ